MNYTYSPILIDQRFTFFIFYIYFSIKKLERYNFNLDRILDEWFLYEYELLMEYQKWYNKWIIQAYRLEKEITIEELSELRKKYTWIFFDLHCILNEENFHNYFDKYFGLLINDKLINPSHIFSTWAYFQSDDFSEQIKIKNFSKFSIQIKEFRNILLYEIKKLWLNNIIVDIKDNKYLNIHIIDLLFFFYYKWYIEINIILFNSSINFNINITEKLLSLIEKEKIEEKFDIKLITIDNNLFYNEERKQIFYNKALFQIKNSKSWTFLKTLLDNFWNKCDHETFKNSYEKYNKNLEKTNKSDIWDILNDDYNNIKKTELKFMIKYITIHKWEWYEIKKNN